MVAFYRVGASLMVSGECLLCCNVGFLTIHPFVYTFKPAAQPGHWGPQPGIPNPHSASRTTDTIPGIHGGGDQSQPYVVCVQHCWQMLDPWVCTRCELVVG